MSNTIDINKLSDSKENIHNNPYISSRNRNKYSNLVLQCMRQDLYGVPLVETPQNLIKFRHCNIPGARAVHPGYYDLPKDYEKMRHGVKTLPSDHVIDCIKSADFIGTKCFLTQVKEEGYPSNKREPIGGSIDRNYIFPDEVKSNNFKFGKVYKQLFTAKDLLYNKGLSCLTEPNNNHIGEQENRHYEWKFDPKTHRFGKPTKIELDGVKKSLNFDDNLPSINKYTNTINSEEMKNNSKKLLSNKYKIVPGKKNISNLDEDFVYGKKSRVGENINAAQLIYFNKYANGNNEEPSHRYVETDPNLGIQRKYKLINSAPIIDKDRVFGIPTVRRDLSKKKLQSFSDNKNYGDQGDVFNLLYPHPCSIRGITDEDFDTLYNIDEIKQFLEENKKSIPDKEIELIWDIALRNYPNNDNVNKLSLHQFLTTMRNLKREYQIYKSKQKCPSEEQNKNK